MIKANRTVKQGTDQQVIQGIKLDLQTMTSLPLGGTSYTPTSLVAFIQSHIDAANAIVTAKASWEKAIATYTAIDKQAQVVLHDLKALVLATFGSTSPRLADFGYKPRKVTVLTPEQKAAAAAKRAATRKARGTMGPKQKLKVTGATTAANAAATAPTTSASTPQATTPPSPAPAAAPAAPAPTATGSVTVNVNPATPPASPTTGTSGASGSTPQSPASPAPAAPHTS